MDGPEFDCNGTENIVAVADGFDSINKVHVSRDLDTRGS